jgi:hypothetical protein
MWKKIIPLFKNLVWTPEHFLWTEQIFYFTVCEHLFCTAWTIYFNCLNIFWANIFKTMLTFFFFHYGFCFEPVNNLDGSNNYLYCTICELLFLHWMNNLVWTVRTYFELIKLYEHFSSSILNICFEIVNIFYERTIIYCTVRKLVFCTVWVIYFVLPRHILN